MGLGLRCLLSIFVVFSLSGCIVAAVAPAVAGLANLTHKSGTMTIELQGSANPLPAFRKAAIAEGGSVTIAERDFARAEFSDVDMKIEAQIIEGGRVRLRGSSLSNVGRSYELEDNITIKTEAVADIMTKSAFSIVSSDRQRGI